LAEQGLQVPELQGLQVQGQGQAGGRLLEGFQSVLHE